MSESVEVEDLNESPPAVPRAGSRVSMWAGIVAVLVAVAATVAALSRGSEPEVIDTPDVPRMQQGHLIYSASFEKRSRIRVEPAREAKLAPVINAVGTVRFNPRYMASIGTRLRGVVRSVKAYEGDGVERGQVVALLDSPELADAQAQVATLRAQAKAAELHAEREASLVAQQLVTARAAEHARAEERVTRRCFVPPSRRSRRLPAVRGVGLLPASTCFRRRSPEPSSSAT